MDNEEDKEAAALECEQMRDLDKRHAYLFLQQTIETNLVKCGAIGSDHCVKVICDGDGNLAVRVEVAPAR